MREYNFYVYILTNKSNKVVYIGITNNLERRVWEHKHKTVKGFTDKYNIDKLVYIEHFNFAHDAIRREKQLKGWRRSKKESLVNKENSSWKDLSADWYDVSLL